MVQAYAPCKTHSLFSGDSDPAVYRVKLITPADDEYTSDTWLNEIVDPLPLGLPPSGSYHRLNRTVEPHGRNRNKTWFRQQYQQNIRRLTSHQTKRHKSQQLTTYPTSTRHVIHRRPLHITHVHAGQDLE